MIPAYLNLFFLKRHNISALFLLSVLLVSLSFSITGNAKYDEGRREILLRRLGHEVLLQSGDSVSRVLPVKRISGNEYEISFENELSFQPASLVNASRRLFASDPRVKDCIVTVLQCESSRVAYGYALSNTASDEIIACLGRRQHKACYRINITFKPKAGITSKNGLLAAALISLICGGFTFLRPVITRRSITSKPVVDQTNRKVDGIFILGSLMFDPRGRKLMQGGQTIALTATETRVLQIFALSPNQMIERSRLQKEIWEDEGVIVGRSLDMFISKLRKKLESGADVKIVVIRGKGYRLEVGG